MEIEFDRCEIERCIKNYSNDILDAFHSPTPTDDATKINAIARAQSVLSDWQYLDKAVTALREQINQSRQLIPKAMAI